MAVWRRRILSAVAWSYLGLGAIAAVIGISVAISHDIWSVVVFDTIALLVGAGLVLCPERFYRLKSISLIVLTYTVGGYFSYQFGPFAAGPLCCSQAQCFRELCSAGGLRSVRSGSW